MSDSNDRTVVSRDSDGDSSIDEAYCAACGQSYPLDTDVCPKDGSRLAKLKARPDALLGRVFEGRYEVRTALGQGGMGTVYRGWQLSVDREVAIKVIHPKLSHDRIAVKRFLREARLSSRLSQPNIVNVYDFGQTDDSILYIVMELLRGHTLARELLAMRPMQLKRVTTIALQLCDALDSAHAQGIIHRDLKPGNIVILDDPPGRDLVKVLDFGLAKSLVADTSSAVTGSSAIVGTPLYMAPEQTSGKPADQRADLYALGCILYHMLTGSPPFVGDTVPLVLAAHMNEKPRPLPIGTPSALIETIERLMEKDPLKRLQSAAAARTGILAVVEGGLESNELLNTVPEVMPDVLPHHAALAETHLAAETPSSPNAKAALVDSIADTPPPNSRRVALALAAIAALAASIALVIVITNRGAGTPATPDARSVFVTPDAARTIESGEASVTASRDADPVITIDTATVITIDAAAKRPPRPPPPPKPLDAGLDFILPD